jgi:large subunit ribosomal protein L21
MSVWTPNSTEGPPESEMRMPGLQPRRSCVLQSEVPISDGELTVFAIIQTSGRQLRVEPGAIIEILGHGREAGAELTFDQVLFVGKDAGEIVAGAPFVSGAKVVGVVDSEGRGPKVRIFKKKRRKQYRRTQGHRDQITRVRITDIQV